MKKILSCCIAAVMLLQTIPCLAAVGTISPEVLQYEDFDYSQTAKQDLTAGEAEASKGFSSGWSNVTLWKVDKIDGKTCLVQDTKNDGAPLQRSVSADKAITTGVSESVVYIVSWEQYIDSSVSLNGAVGSCVGFDVSGSNVKPRAGFGKNGSDTYPLLVWGNSGAKWGANKITGSQTYEMVLMIEANPTGVKDRISFKVYPKDGEVNENWDIVYEENSAITQTLLGIRSQITTGNPYDVRFSDYKVELYSGSAKTAYTEANTAISALPASLKTAVLEEGNIEACVSAVQEKIDVFAACTLKDILQAGFDSAKKLADKYTAVRTALDTADNSGLASDIEAAQTLINDIEDAEIKTYYEGILNYIKNRAQAESKTEAAEADPSYNNIKAAYDLLKDMPDNTLTSGLFVRLAECAMTLVGQSNTADNLDLAIAVVDRLPNGDDKDAKQLVIVTAKVELTAVSGTEQEVCDMLDTVYSMAESTTKEDMKYRLTVRLADIQLAKNSIDAADYALVAERAEKLSEADKQTFAPVLTEIKARAAITAAPAAVDKADATKNAEDIASAQEWVMALTEGVLKTELTARLDAIAEASGIRYIYDDYSGEEQTISNLPALSEASAERGFSSGWSTTVNLDIAAGGVRIKDGFLQVNGSLAGYSIWRGLSNTINLGKDGEYYLSYKLKIPANCVPAATETNRSTKLQLRKVGSTTPFIMFGFIGSGTGGLYPFTKMTDIAKYDAQTFAIDKTYIIKVKISAKENGSDSFYLKAYEAGTQEPSDWQVSSIATSDDELAVIDYNTNAAVTFGFGDLLVERYEGVVLDKLNTATKKLEEAMADKSLANYTAANQAVDLLCSCIASDTLKAQLNAVKAVVDVKTDIDTLLSQLEASDITASNLSEAKSKLADVEAKLAMIPTENTDIYQARALEISKKISKLEAEANITTENLSEWTVTTDAQTVSVSKSINLAADADSEYYLKLALTPTAASAKVSFGANELVLDSLKAGEENTVYIMFQDGKTVAEVYDAQGVLCDSASIDQTASSGDVFGITMPQGSTYQTLSVNAIDTAYAAAGYTLTSQLTPTSKLAEITAAENAAQGFANGILSEIIQKKLTFIKEENKKAVPKIDMLSITEHTGGVLKASASLIDVGGNFDKYEYLWQIGGQTISTTDTATCPTGNTITLTITPISVYGVRGETKIVSKSIAAGGSYIGGASSGGGGGGGGSSFGGGYVVSTPTTPTTNESQTTSSFADTIGHWAGDDIEYMAQNGYVSGVGNGLFSPDTFVTRAEFATLIANILRLEKRTPSFADVDNNEWYSGFIGAVAELRIMSGDGERFYPMDNITRQEMAVAVMNCYEHMGKTMELKENKSFSDGSLIESWAAQSVDKCVRLGIMSGNTDGSFRPQANATRAEATVVLKKLILSK